MKVNLRACRSRLCLDIVLIAAILVAAVPAYAQEEVASTLLRYGEREVVTGYYEDYEAIPRHRRLRTRTPTRPGLNRIFPYSPTAARVRIRTRLADSHAGIKFYDVLRCEYCHAEQTRDIHTVRANLTCRQCHGGEPIAAIEHAFSPMNPIRRHAYVCAKCHEGANPSFATYVVHQPDPGSATAQREFPTLYYAYWFMLALLVGTLAFFLPHTFMVGFREVVSWLRHKKGRGRGESDGEGTAEAQEAGGEAGAPRSDAAEDADGPHPEPEPESEEKPAAGEAEAVGGDSQKDVEDDRGHLEQEHGESRKDAERRDDGDSERKD